MRSLLALLQTCLSICSRYSCPTRRMRRSSTGFGSGCNKCLVWEHMIVNPLSSLSLAKALSPMPILHSPRLRWRAQSRLLTHWMGRVPSANDAPKSRSSRPAHVGSFAEDAVLRGLVMNLLLSICEEGIPVDTPIESALSLPR